MKEDILEQLVDEYLQHKGYFTRHNIKFKPDQDHPDYVKKSDSNHSDIDVLAIHPNIKGVSKVIAVSCKSWQGGFFPEVKIRELEENKIVSGREAWKGFRELVIPKWSEAFVKTITEVTGSCKFTYLTAVTVIKGEKAAWEKYPRFTQAMNGNPVKLLEISDILEEIYPDLTTTMASTDIGRLLQVVKASGWLKK